jgi:polyhydroxyalkanoate synthase
VLGTFTDAETVERLEAKMARQGYLEGREMATTFDLLRANDLIWNYVVSNWLMGEDPPAFDILAWNADSTRMPAAMHSFYLRTCYLAEPAGQGRDGAGRGAPEPGRGDPGPVPGRGRDRPHHPLDLVVQHHPAGQGRRPVRAQLLGPHRGHRQPAQPQGPPLDQRREPSRPQVWLAGATEHQGSWWEDWVDWAKAHGGQRRKPRPWAATSHPPIADAPGSYVHEK